MPGSRRRQPVRYLVFSASLRRDSLNTRLAELAAAAIEVGGGDVDVAAMRDFDARHTTRMSSARRDFRRAPRSSGGGWRPAMVSSWPHRSTTRRCRGF